MKPIANNRLSEIKALVSNIEFDVDSDGVGVEYEDKHFYLYAMDFVDAPEEDFIKVAIKTRNTPINDITFKEFQITPTTEEIEVILDAMHQAYNAYIEQLGDEERESAYNALADKETEDFINHNFYTHY